jgi:M6 family metalloprotease-like protein
LRDTPEARTKLSQARRRAWEAETQIDQRWSQQKAAFLHPNAPSNSGPQSRPPGFTTLGDKVGLCILVDFDDDPATIPQADIIEFCNGDNYTQYGNMGSVKQYFLENSNGLLRYTNVVTLYIRIPNGLHPKSYYNDTAYACATQGRKLVADVVSVMKSLPNYSTEILPAFDVLTVNYLNEVVACNVYFAGANSGVWSKGLWPHASAFAPFDVLELEPWGRKIKNYQVSEIGAAPRLGGFCHENGHMLCGFPDIYDYNYDSKGGAGRYCIMNMSGGNPSQFCAYLKLAAGWATVTDLDFGSSFVATLSAIPGPEFNHFFRWLNPYLSTEYFLLESRYNGPASRDSWMWSSGVAVWHIDELGDHDNQNLTPNTTHHNYEVTLVQADNRWDFQNNRNYFDRADLYFLGNTATNYTNEFSDNSAPSAQWWDGSSSGLLLRDFSSPGPEMAFIVGYYDVSPLVLPSPSDQSVIIGDPVTFAAGVVGTQPVTYQWFFDGKEIPGATDPSYRILSTAPTHIGGYHVVVQNYIGASTSHVATLTLLPFPTLPEALNTTNLVWTTSPGQSAWTVVRNDEANDLVAAAKSGRVTGLGESWLETTITNGPGTLTFWWRSDVAAGNTLEFYIAGTFNDYLANWRGPWRQRTVSIPPGTHRLRWVYVQRNTNYSEDYGCLDEVRFTPSAAPPALLSPRCPASGQFEFDVAGSVGTDYVVLASTNLLDWVPVLTNTAPFVFTDSDAAKRTGRYYRARYR